MFTRSYPLRALPDFSVENLTNRLPELPTRRPSSGPDQVGHSATQAEEETDLPTNLEIHIPHHLPVDFPEGAWARVIKDPLQLEMHNHARNHELLRHGLSRMNLLPLYFQVDLEEWIFPLNRVRELERQHGVPIPERVWIELRAKEADALNRRDQLHVPQKENVDIPGHILAGHYIPLEDLIVLGIHPQGEGGTLETRFSLRNGDTRVISVKLDSENEVFYVRFLRAETVDEAGKTYRLGEPAKGANPTTRWYPTSLNGGILMTMLRDSAFGKTHPFPIDDFFNREMEIIRRVETLRPDLVRAFLQSRLGQDLPPDFHIREYPLLGSVLLTLPEALHEKLSEELFYASEFAGPVRMGLLVLAAKEGEEPLDTKALLEQWRQGNARRLAQWEFLGILGLTAREGVPALQNEHVSELLEITPNYWEDYISFHMQIRLKIPGITWQDQGIRAFRAPEIGGQFLRSITGERVYFLTYAEETRTPTPGDEVIRP